MVGGKGCCSTGYSTASLALLVFVPQIMILFGLTSALEATGYMARVGFLGDRFLERLGLSGRSVVPLIGGMACAVPAVMAARTIPGKREQLITILVTPLMTCAARLPVYAFLIGFVVPNTTVWGFKVQGLFLFGLYVASSISALALGLGIEPWVAQQNGRPVYHGMARLPMAAAERSGPRNGEQRLELCVQCRSSHLDHLHGDLGLSQFGPSDAMEAVEDRYAHMEDEAAEDIEAARMEASWLGHLGNWIEPAVRPLGYDGRMGIAILSSFAAREVFVGTMSTLFPGGAEMDSDEGRIRQLQQRLTQEVHPATGKPLLNTASAASLLIFYMYAMQCMSTVVIVRKELKSWPWALAQAIGFTLFAYGLALLVYQVLA